MSYQPDLFAYLVNPPKPRVPLWKPRALTVEQWRETNGPNYAAIFAWRLKKLDEYIANLKAANF